MTDMQEPLFHVAPVKPISRARVEILGLIRHGMHPISRALRIPIWLSPKSTPTPFPHAGPMCGTCRFAAPLGEFADDPTWTRRVFKCWRWPHRVTRGARTDIRLGWPACIRYEERQE